MSISTGGTVQSGPNGSVYAGSKAAIEQISMALAKELANRKVTVNTVLPGVTDTDGLVIPQRTRDHLIQTPTSVSRITLVGILSVSFTPFLWCVTKSYHMVEALATRLVDMLCP